jgi:glutamyl-tRNA reductase
MTAPLFVVGISWRTAPVAVREKLAFRDEELPDALGGLRDVSGVAEAMLISTCNRVEVYGVARPDVAAVVGEVRAYLARNRGIPEDAVGGAVYWHGGGPAIRHVFRVAAALDSLVVGEAQILGQLKAAFAVAGSHGAVGPVLGRCLERAFGAAKRVRTETAIARGAANVSSVAVELATRVFGDLSGKTVLVIGAGKMSTLAARHLRDAGVAEIVVTNRSADKAERLADDIDGIARPWERLEDLLAAADVVISSTGAREPILTRALLKQVAKARRWRPLMIVDIAVPRDADPAIGKLEGVYLFDIDDLDRVVASNLAERERAAADAARIIDAEAAQFEQWLVSQRVVPAIRALRAEFTRIADAEAQKVIEQMRRRDLSQDQRDEAVRRLAQLVVNKLLHAPQTALKDATPGEAEWLVEAAARLHRIDLAGPAGPVARVDAPPERAEPVEAPTVTPPEPTDQTPATEPAPAPAAAREGRR